MINYWILIYIIYNVIRLHGLLLIYKYIIYMYIY